MQSRSGQLRSFGESLYIADGPAVSFFGFPYPTRMAVARLPSGALWIWSPIALTDELTKEVRALGKPRYVVEPNKLHHLALGAWVEAFPKVQLYAPPGLAEKRDDLHFAGALGVQAPADWEHQIDLVPIEGSFAMTEVLFFHRPSRTCLVGDLVQKHEPEAMKTWRRWIMKADGLTGSGGSTPREWRLTFTNRGKARAALERALAWEPERLLIAHGTCAEANGAAVLRHSLAWLHPRPFSSLPSNLDFPFHAKQDVNVAGLHWAYRRGAAKQPKIALGGGHWLIRLLAKLKRGWKGMAK